jgi:hypothetical protein
VIPYKPGFIYLIRAIDTAYYKIGYTNNPSRRFSQISPKMPFKTKQMKVWRTNCMDIAEKMLHEIYAEYRTNGEWFDLPDSEIYEILYDDPYGFSWMVCNAYGQAFLDSLDMSESEEKLLASTLEAETHGLINRFSIPFGSQFIAWVDYIFLEIQESRACTKEDKTLWSKLHPIAPISDDGTDETFDVLPF